MVLQEELQLALFKTPSGENLFLDRVSIYYAFLFVKFSLTHPNYAIHIAFCFSLIIFKIFTLHTASVDNDMKLRLSP
jgi:hypothetical protein